MKDARESLLMKDEDWISTQRRMVGYRMAVLREAPNALRKVANIVDQM